MGDQPKCPRCDGPEVATAPLLCATSVMPFEEAWRRLIKAGHLLLCARCLTSRQGSIEQAADAIEAHGLADDAFALIKFEQSRETERRAKLARAMEGRW